LLESYSCQGKRAFQKLKLKCTTLSTSHNLSSSCPKTLSLNAISFPSPGRRTSTSTSFSPRVFSAEFPHDEKITHEEQMEFTREGALKDMKEACREEGLVRFHEHGGNVSLRLLDDGGLQYVEIK